MFIVTSNVHLRDERVCWGGEGQAALTLVGSSRSLKAKKFRFSIRRARRTRW